MGTIINFDQVTRCIHRMRLLLLSSKKGRDEFGLKSPIQFLLDQLDYLFRFMTLEQFVHDSMPSTEFRLILGLVLNNETQQHTMAACYHWSYLLFNRKFPITFIPTRPDSDVFLNYPVISTMGSDLYPCTYNDEEAVSNEP